jgi:hypothetical protein
MSLTQTLRPSLTEAAEEASMSPDTHWTASLSSAGMTRIARSVVMAQVIR